MISEISPVTRSPGLPKCHCPMRGVPWVFYMNFWKMSGCPSDESCLCWLKNRDGPWGIWEGFYKKSLTFVALNPASSAKFTIFFVVQIWNSRGEEGWTWGRFRPLNGSMGAGIYLEAKWPLFLKVNPPKTRHFPIKTKVSWVLGIPIFCQMLPYQRYWEIVANPRKWGAISLKCCKMSQPFM